MRRSQQNWLVTGASSGFGREIARAVIASGGTVFATARNPDALRSLVAGAAGRCFAHPLDVTNSDAVTAAVTAAETALGSIDVLVNNAGYGLLGSVEHAPADAIRTMFAVNYFGAVDLIRAVLPGMRIRGRGWIVNVSSIGGRVAAPAIGHYCASKHALGGLSKALRDEVSPFGIGVTVVEPGSFRTDFAGRSLVAAEEHDPGYAATISRIATAVRGGSGRERGDPARAAAAILAALDLPEPPRQLVLGPDALALARKAAEADQAELDQFAALGSATDFAGTG